MKLSKKLLMKEKAEILGKLGANWKKLQGSLIKSEIFKEEDPSKGPALIRSDQRKG